MEQDNQVRMKRLVQQLQEASKAYYAQDTEVISNYEYDKLYEELVELEGKTGIVLADSPTVTVGYEAVAQLPKEKHESPMLSLGKTKSREELKDWLKGQTALLSWKLDGLTVVLTYSEGKLAKAVTRGNGEVGEVITNNAKVFKNIPLSIAYQGTLILRGEAVIRYSDFVNINEQIDEADAKYKNPRNLCSGSVRQLNNEITAGRQVRFYAFALVQADGVEFHNAREEQFRFLQEQGFEVVSYVKVQEDTILEEIGRYEKDIVTYDIPSDGLVLCLNDIAYSKSLGRTAKFPRDSIAFKWADEIAETTLTQIEWSPSRTGLINPVAVFEPVELEGTTVSRASVHNISVMQSLQLGIGDRITVYKANMIIPQIAENLTKSNHMPIPEICPVCGQPTTIQQMNDVKVLYCKNPACEIKKIKAFTLFAGRDALNIEGLSEASLEKFIAKGFIHEFADIFHLEKHREELMQMEGFGDKSYRNLWDSIQTARKTTYARVIYGLGIANIGVSNAKMLCREYRDDFNKMRQASITELSAIDGIGEVIAKAFVDYFESEENRLMVDRLLQELTIQIEDRETVPQTMSGMNFVITGSLLQYENREAMKAEIEQKGGKVTGSVTSKTTALINNDAMSHSSKNKKARELGIQVLTEDEFIEKYLTI
ncbi:MAG: NAD-dependent DNA ligase LigA [Lachnospiraceae bacterium]